MRNFIIIVVCVLGMFIISSKLYAAQVPRTAAGIESASPSSAKPLSAMSNKQIIPIMYGSSKDARKARTLYIKRQQSFLKAMPNKEMRAELTYLLNYQPKAYERFNKFGDIIRKLPSGQEVVFDGYVQKKTFYEALQKIQRVKAPEIEALKGKKLMTSESDRATSGQVLTKHFEIETDIMGPDPLNTINPLYHRNFYHPQGFMYWAHELYNDGVFPFLPYLTSVKDQRARGTCASFAMLGAAEILLMNRPDLSEQNHYYHRIYKRDLMFNSKPIGAEDEWPYNGGGCYTMEYWNWLLSHEPQPLHPKAPEFDDSEAPEQHVQGEPHFYLDLATNEWIPCSDTEHQGIPLLTFAGKIYMPYKDIVGTTEGRCTLMIPDVLEGIPHEMRARAQLLGSIVNDLKYPVKVHVPMATASAPDSDGMCVGQNCFDFSGWVLMDHEGEVEGLGHGMLIVAYIPKEKIPNAIKQNPHFVPNENYFIIKNSWGSNYGDGGFIYVPEIMLGTYNQDAWTLVFRYDNGSEYYSNCPPRATSGVQ